MNVYFPRYRYRGRLNLDLPFYPRNIDYYFDPQSDNLAPRRRAVSN